MNFASRKQRPAAAVWLGAVLVAVAGAWDASAWDLPLARLAGTDQGFAWRDHWLLATVLHQGARWAAWALVLALTLAVWWPPRPWVRLPAARRLQLVVTALLAAATVAVLKWGATSSCPWDLSAFGGLARHVSHWQRVADGGPGHCFPAGHAACGFSLAGGYFAWRGVDAGVALGWLTGAAVAGLVLGLAQQWRGAHFMSHTLWTAVVCWWVAAAVDAGFCAAARGAA